MEYCKRGREEKDFPDWRKKYMEVLAKYFDVEFLIPKAGEVDETDHLLVLGKDSIRIKVCDLVVMHAEEKLGAGTAGNGEFCNARRIREMCYTRKI